jgi:hypothetical protein
VLIYVCSYMCAHICVHIYVYSHMCTHICVLMYVYTYMCTHICVLIYVYTYMCAHIWAFSYDRMRADRARFAGFARVGRRCGRARHTTNNKFSNCGGWRSTRDRLADGTLWAERRNEPEISCNVTDSLGNEGVLCWITPTGS